MARRALPVAVSVLVLAGCGGGDRLSHDEYQRLLTQRGNALNETVRAEQDEPARIEARLNRLADELERTRPPADAQGAHDEFTRALRAYALTMSDFLLEFRTARTNRRRGEALTRLSRSPAARELQRARASLARAGYELP